MPTHSWSGSLRTSKTDLGREGSIYLGKTDSPSALPLHCLITWRSSNRRKAALHGTTFTRDQFVRGVKVALSAAQIAHKNYFGHSFHISTATAVAAAGHPHPHHQDARPMVLLGIPPLHAHPKGTLAPIHVFRQLAL